VPGLTVHSHVHFKRLLAMAEPLAPIVTAVVAPETPAALAGALLGAQHTLITPILIGDASKIAEAAQEGGLDLNGHRIIDLPDHQQAAARWKWSTKGRRAR